MTTLTVWDLWDDPVAVAELLQLWDDVRGAAGGGLGCGLPLDSRGHKQQRQSETCVGYSFLSPLSVED